MENFFSRLIRIGFLTILAAGIAQAQYLVSSKAGFVNRVEGKANIKHPSGIPGEISKASLGAQMLEGERLVTEEGGRAEILLSPGSYLRVNEKSEVEAVRTGFESTRFNVIQGSVIIEAGEIDKKIPFEIGTPRTVVAINKTGIYRIDVLGQDVAVSVRQGELYLGTADQLLAKSANKIGSKKAYRFIGDGAPITAKLSEKVFDNFDEWSYLRSESLMAANYSVLRRMRSRDALLSGWIYDPFMNSYTYIPTSWAFFNPYGFGFYRRFSDCDLCWGYPAYGSGIYYPTPSTGGGGGTQIVHPRVSNTDRASNNPQTSRGDAPSRHVEPYTRPSNTFSRSGNGNSGYSSNDSSFGSSRGVTYDRSSSTPVYSAPAVIAPAPSRDAGGSANTGRGGDSGRSTSRGN